MRRVLRSLAIVVLGCSLLVACGGDGSVNGPTSAKQARQLSRSAKSSASPYEQVVQQLYVSYFGRPADPAGVANFESSLAALSAPTDIQSLSTAYATNSGLRALIDSFGTSNESKTLYGGSTPTQFVSAIFQNVLSRQPAQAGLDFWVNAITSGTLSQGDAALAIMTGALTNNSAQGLLDAQLIQNRLAVASYFTAQVATQNASSSYAGANAAALARAMLSGVSASTDINAYEASINSTILGLQLKVIAPIIGAAQTGPDIDEPVEYGTVDSNQIVAAQGTLVVPAEPPPSGTVYLGMWLGPSRANVGTVGPGNFEATLIWGPSCAPGAQPANHGSWWISGLYVNENNTPHCQGGNTMQVAVGDVISIAMVLNGTVWNETITDTTSGNAVTYSIDLHGQPQNFLYLPMQGASQVPVSWVNWSNVSFTLASPEPDACFAYAQPGSDIVAASIMSSDQMHCMVPNVSLYPGLVPTVKIQAQPNPVLNGQSTSLVWSSTNVTACTASGAWQGAQNTSGTQGLTTRGVGNFVYTLTCNGSVGTVTSSTTLNVVEYLPPVVTISMASPTANTGQSIGLTWNAANSTSCTASGNWSGTQALSGTVLESFNTAGTYTFTLTCTGAGGTSSASTTLTTTPPPTNVVPVVVDGGNLSGFDAINRPYVSVTICAPGSSTQCQTINHVTLDTGSTGLRLSTSAITPALLAQMPAATDSSGNVLGECYPFASGTSWGGVHKADVLMGNEMASGITFQTINELPGGNGAPTACTDQGSSFVPNSLAGSNGLLGVSAFPIDCGDCNVQEHSLYFSCNAGGCVDTTIAPTNVIANPVARFLNDNNGIVLSFPASGIAGASNLAGTLTFGIGTQNNNRMPSQTRLAEGNSGNIQAIYNAQTYPGYLDTGSISLYFPDASLPLCTQAGWTASYCPTSPTPLSMTLEGYGTTQTEQVNLTLENLFTAGNIDALSIGSNASVNVGSSAPIVLGLPFFYGRTVYSAFYNAATPAGSGPYFSF